jgi:hypothetical protein
MTTSNSKLTIAVATRPATGTVVAPAPNLNLSGNLVVANGSIIQANMISSTGTLTSNAILVTDDVFISDKLAIGITKTSYMLEPPERLYLAEGNIRVVRGNIDVLTGNINVRDGNIFGVRFGDLIGRPQSTDDLAEGATNKYHTTERVRAALQAGLALDYAAASGTFAARHASIYEEGVVRLSDTVGDPSVQRAATANAVKTVYDALTLLTPSALNSVDRGGDTMSGALHVANLVSVEGFADQAAILRAAAQGPDGEAFLSLDRGGQGGWSMGVGTDDAFVIRPSNTFATSACSAVFITPSGNVGLAGCSAPTCSLDVGEARLGAFVANLAGLFSSTTGDIRFGPFKANEHGVFIAATDDEVMVRSSESNIVEANGYPLAASVW